jgi:TPR repeat protein
MRSISLATAIALTGRSERTLWRYLADGAIARAPESVSGKTLIDIDSLTPYLSLPLGQEELALVARADAGGAGSAEAQNELGLRFLSAGKPDSAIYWLEQSANQGCADAMHWLGRCHIDGSGTPPDKALGIMWLSRAAAQGHIISRAQINGLMGGVMA